eukprot:5040360-Pyramimonas_sp.AAC.1
MLSQKARGTGWLGISVWALNGAFGYSWRGLEVCIAPRDWQPARFLFREFYRKDAVFARRDSSWF